MSKQRVVQAVGFFPFLFFPFFSILTSIYIALCTLCDYLLLFAFRHFSFSPFSGLLEQGS